MGYITTPLFNILRLADEDLSKPSGVYNACMETVFDDDMLAPIESRHRQRLVTGFGLHYFRDEIGQETVPLFKMTVMEKLYNNAEELNSIFDNLDKQIYKRYAVHNAEHADQTADASVSNEEGLSSEISNGSSVDKNNMDSVANRVHADNQNSQSSQASNESGQDNRQHMSSANAHDANSTSNTENSVDTNNQHEASNDTNSRATNSNAQTINDSNTLSASLDTPQGSISAMRTPVGSTPVALKGTGIDAEVLAQYRYLTAAATTDGSTVASDQQSSNEAGNTVHNSDSNGQSNSNRQSNGASNSVHSDEQSSQEQSQNARQAQTVSDEQMQSAGTEENRQTTQNEAQRQSSDQRQGANSVQKTDNRTGASSGNENAVDYELTNEMLATYIPLMARVWKIFDPCFCMLLD